MTDILGIPWYGILIICFLCIAVFTLLMECAFLKSDKKFYQDLLAITKDKEKIYKELCVCYKAELETSEKIIGTYKAWLGDPGGQDDGGETQDG